MDAFAGRFNESTLQARLCLCMQRGQAGGKGAARGLGRWLLAGLAAAAADPIVSNASWAAVPRSASLQALLSSPQALQALAAYHLLEDRVT